MLRLLAAGKSDHLARSEHIWSRWKNVSVHGLHLSPGVGGIKGRVSRHPPFMREVMRGK